MSTKYFSWLTYIIVR